jgi:condensin-2 complex subunit H2
MEDDNEEVVSNRFKTLIQPIKELAANWDIDIADSLNDYLDELSRLSFRLDDEESDEEENPGSQKKKTTKKLNFAEAALLIQGSTMIYSKKVEYLYQLVLKSLETITHKKSNILKETDPNNTSVDDEKKTNGKGGKKNSNKLDFDYFNMTVEYLLLDDIIEPGKNITVEPKRDDSMEIERSRFSSVKEKETLCFPLVSFNNFFFSFITVRSRILVISRMFRRLLLL